MTVAIHATPAAAPSDVARGTFRANLRAHLADAGGNSTWSDDTLNHWIDDGIDELNRHLPKRRSVLIPLVAGQVDYTPAELGIGDFLDVERVEYPADACAASRSFLLRIDRDAGAFGPGAYDFRWPTLTLGDVPSAGELLRLFYFARRRRPTNDLAVLDLPVEYHHVLREWIVWQAALERRNHEMRSPTENSLLLSLLDGVAMHHERTHQAALKTITGQSQRTVSPGLSDRWRSNPWS